ncbi:hypothetical protein Q4Q34_15335 [Flavivirga abyssicola]|uniref:hypothetical protein n=1 Tax=Flavivirga abyssicola TaxID=3063533 RepID=UPI0026DF7DC4|nr:hypothetical protein [Flavivirga sp. MEBiC07777]WVK12589.1 hypothetical protein Q4Q34_15335 [Flavivirga sp. MEBiC07777]
MKKQFNLKSKYLYLSLIIVTVLFSSCESEFKEPSDNFNSAPPVISSVSETKEDKAVTQGVLDNVYTIRGENLSSLVAIYFNGFKASFNPALLTDNTAFVKVPEEAPVLGQSNKMTVENLFGSVEYDFSLLTITDFTEATVNGTKVVNLLGGDFSETSLVTFVSGSEENGNLVELPANFTIISAGEVQAEVPPGVEQAFIFLETSRGAIARSESYGFSYSIYIDGLNTDWSTTEWSGTHDLESTEVVLGEFSVKSVREGWSGLTFWPDDVTINYNDYDAITVSIYGTGAPGDSVNLALNDFQTQLNLQLVPGEWTKFVIPLSDFYPSGGAPDTIFRIDFQEASGTGMPQYIFYVDDFGFL